MGKYLSLRKTIGKVKTMESFEKAYQGKSSLIEELDDSQRIAGGFITVSTIVAARRAAEKAKAVAGEHIHGAR